METIDFNGYLLWMCICSLYMCLYVNCRYWMFSAAASNKALFVYLILNPSHIEYKLKLRFASKYPSPNKACKYLCLLNTVILCTSLLTIAENIWATTSENIPSNMCVQKRLRSFCVSRRVIRAFIVRMKRRCIFSYPNRALWRFLSKCKCAGWSESFGTRVQRYAFWLNWRDWTVNRYYITLILLSSHSIRT